MCDGISFSRVGCSHHWHVTIKAASGKFLPNTFFFVIIFGHNHTDPSHLTRGRRYHTRVRQFFSRLIYHLRAQNHGTVEIRFDSGTISYGRGKKVTSPCFLYNSSTAINHESGDKFKSSVNLSIIFFSNQRMRSLKIRTRKIISAFQTMKTTNSAKKERTGFKKKRIRFQKHG